MPRCHCGLGRGQLPGSEEARNCRCGLGDAWSDWSAPRRYTPNRADARLLKRLINYLDSDEMLNILGPETADAVVDLLLKRYDLYMDFVRRGNPTPVGPRR